MNVTNTQVSNKILVVDDDASIREMIALALEDEGLEVIGAPEGETALAMIPEIQPDLILLDTRMPIMDGREFALRYKQLECLPAPLIILTAVDNPESTAAEIGADGFLPKPFDLEDLSRVVSKYLRMKR
ncbi:MAG: response regulator [Sphaerobacteraceae bacterium]|nr:MAG: response regulator [Sphaerobacteraceae bacterium]